MTLLEAVKAGIIRVRRKTWITPTAYLKLGYDAQVGLYPVAHLYERETQKSIGEPTPQVVNSHDYWDDDYEEYKGVRDKDDTGDPLGHVADKTADDFIREMDDAYSMRDRSIRDSIRKSPHRRQLEMARFPQRVVGIAKDLEYYITRRGLYDNDIAFERTIERIEQDISCEFRKCFGIDLIGLLSGPDSDGDSSK